MTALTALAALAAAQSETAAPELPVDLEIRRFLNGESDGGPLFQALYGDLLDEPIPDHLLAIVRCAK